MAGEGSRFANAGYTLPKPLIDVDGKPMIQVVVENLNIPDARYIFIVRKEHRRLYDMDTILNRLVKNCIIIETDGLTEGAACSIMLAKDYIDSDTPLLLANSDQYIEWNAQDFLSTMHSDRVDGGIVTFEDLHPRWSYAKTDVDNRVTEVAEKNPISTHATTGVYFWKRGSDFVKYAQRMISENIRVNNEFYTCPVFNQAIQDNKNIIAYPAESMHGLGIPEDLEQFLRHKFNSIDPH